MKRSRYYVVFVRADGFILVVVQLALTATEALARANLAVVSNYPMLAPEYKHLRTCNKPSDLFVYRHIALFNPLAKGDK